MHYNVPQFIDLEDTIVGPLTAKQVLWLFGMAAALLVVWMATGDWIFFLIVAAPVAIIFLALAFYRPNGQPFVKFITHIILFLIKPKIYMWKRDDVKSRNIKKTKKIETNNKHKRKTLKQEELIDLAKILDSESEILKK